MEPAKLKGVVTGKRGTQVYWLMAGQNSIVNGNAEIEDHLNCGEYISTSTDSSLITGCNHDKNIFRRVQSHLYCYFSAAETLLNY